MAASKIVLAVAMVVMLIVGFAVGLVAGPLLMPQSTAADPIWDNIVATGKIKIGTDPNWPPYESLDGDGNIVGFEVDLANAVAGELGLTVEWQSLGFDTIISSVKDKSIDMGVSGFSVTPTRVNEVLFTIPHTNTRGQVIMPESKRDSLHITTLTSLSQLKGLGVKVGVQSGTTELDELSSAGVSYTSFGDYAAAVQDMMSANPSVDCVYAETPITTAWIVQYGSHGQTIVVVYDVPYYPCAFIANINAHTFVAKVNGALADIIQTGTMDTLKARWNATVT